MQEDADSPWNYNAIRRGAEAHRHVRAYARKAIKPGMSMTEIANMIEDGTRALVEEDGMKSGIGFPTGLSRNHCAAHYTPNAGDNIGLSYHCFLRKTAQLTSGGRWRTVLQYEDVLKVDIGIHVNGRIVDSAFTLNWEPTYDKLLEAVKDATNTGVRVRRSHSRPGADL